MKKIMALCIAICALISLCACSHSKSQETAFPIETLTQTATAESDGDWSLQEQSLPLPENITTAQGECLVGNRVFLFSNEGKPSLGFTELGGDVGIIELPGNYEYIHAICDAGGNLAVLAGSFPDEYINVDGEDVFNENIQGVYDILVFDEAGELLSNTPLEKQYDGKSYVFRGMAFVDGEYILMSEYYLIRVGSDGQEMSRSAEKLSGMLYRQVCVYDGQVIACKGNLLNVGSEIDVLDIDTMSPSASFSFSDMDIRGFGVTADGKLLVNNAVSTTGSVNSFDLCTGELEEVFSWSKKADVISQDYNMIIEFEGDYLALGHDQDAVNIYRRVTSSKTCAELTLALIGNRPSAFKLVSKFNAENNGYHITVVNYGYSDGDMDNLKVEMATGKGPDIYAFTDAYTLNEIEGSGAFENLLPWLDADDEYGRDTLIPGLFDALSATGKMYRIPYDFSIDTYVGPGSIIKEPGITMEELKKLASENLYLHPFPAWITQQILLARMSISTIGSYVDWETGTCQFDSEEFIATLESCKETTTVTGNSDDVNEKGLLQYELLQGPFRASRLSSVYGEDYVFVGFPNDCNNGSMYFMQLNFAISSQCEYKEGAWQFVRSVLNDENQKDVLCFPSTNSAFDEMLDAAVSDRYVTSDGNVCELSGADAAKLRELIDGTNTLSGTNETLINIIREEGQAYFAGQCTAAEAAKNIQSRASIYMAEKSG